MRAQFKYLVVALILCFGIYGCKDDPSEDDIFTQGSGQSSSNSGNSGSPDSAPTFYYGIDDNGSLYEKTTKTYYHSIYFGFGVSAGNYTLGMRDYGLVIGAEDATYDGISKNSNLWLTNYGSSMKYLYDVLSDNYAHSCGTYMTFKSKNKTIRLKYGFRYFNSKTNSYVEAKTETVTYTPKTVTEY